MKYLYCFLFLLGLSLAKGQEYLFRQMPVEYGIEVQQVNILFQARDQMIWLGTDAGLLSFDGRAYFHYARPDGKTINVTTISECAKGELWVGYEDGYIHILTNTGTTRRVIADSIKEAAVTGILLHAQQIYIATYGEGLWTIRENQPERLAIPGIELMDIYEASNDGEGNIWMATDQGVVIFDPEKNQSIILDQTSGLADEIVTKLFIGPNQEIWIGFYDAGFSRINIKDHEVILSLDTLSEKGNVVAITRGINGELFFARERGIIRYSSGELHEVKLPVYLNDRLEDILLDKTGNLWVCSGNKIYTANTHLDVIDPDVQQIQAVEQSGGFLWIGTETGLFSLDLKSKKISRHLANEMLNVLSIYADPEGFLWIGTFGQGLYVYNPEEQEARHLTEAQDGISNNSILNISGLNETVWLATLGGVTEIKREANEYVISLFEEQYSFPAGYVYDIYAAPDGKIWFGTDGKGLYLLEKGQLRSFSGQLKYFEKDSIDLRTIYSITGDHENNLWISISKGNVVRLNASGQVTKRITTAFGSLNSLNTTGEGEIIIVRDGGIEVIHPIAGSSIYSAATGLGSFSPNINSTARSPDGSVWIADTDKILHYSSRRGEKWGLVEIHPLEITPGTLLHEGPIRLRPDSNYFDFRFTGLWYPDPQSVRYRYVLKGHDQDWIYTREGRVVYSKLPPGTYTFHVEASHNDDFSNAIPWERSITVLPPIYLRWWFVLAVAVLIALLAYQFFRGRIRRINRFHELEKEKTTLQLNAIQAQVNPHFLFNSFNTLAGIIEEDQEAAVAYVDQLSSFFRGVLLHRDTELIKVSEEINILHHYAYILKKRYGNNILFEENITSMEGSIAPLTLQLLVENAIKHNTMSRDRPLRITINLDREWLEVINPVFPKFQSGVESTGFGLSSLLTRYQYLTDKKIEIVHDRNIFKVRIPIIHRN